MHIIALPEKAKYIKNNSGDTLKWCYLGKDTNKRKIISDVLGEKTRFYFKDSLQNKARELSRFYIDFVADLGKNQTNRANWWASRFASKKQEMQTDFFLFLCYKALAMDLLEENTGNERWIIFIEDPWLFTDLKKMALNKKIEFLGNPGIFLNKSFLLSRGIIRRVLLTGWIAVSWLLINFYHKGGKPDVLKTEKSALAIINPSEPRAFKNGKYIDNYMPGLADFYRKNKVSFFYLYPLRFSLSTAKHVGANRKALWPLMLNINFFDALKRMFDYWKPDMPGDMLKRIAGYDASMLLEREKWVEFSSAGFNLHLILHDALNNFFEKKWCRSIVYVFENQPWEKMLCMAAKKNGVQTIGYQHSSIGRFCLSQFIGKGEDAFAPLPDKIITSGAYFAELYKEGGIPEDKIVVGGAWRYPHVIDGENKRNFYKSGSNIRLDVLICLPLDYCVARSMLENILKVKDKNQLDKKMELIIKLHPGYTAYEINKLKNLTARFSVIDKPYKEILKGVDIVISSTSISGLEAFLCGKKVINYITENLLVADPLYDIQHKRIYKWFEGEDIDIDFLNAPQTVSDLNDIPEETISKYFGKIDGKVWSETALTKSIKG